MAESSTSIRSLFAAAKSAHSKLQSLDSSDGSYQQTIESAISSLAKCRITIDQAALFSPNETSDDIATSSIMSLSVDYLLADLLIKTYGNDRASLLLRASSLIRGFLERLENYELLSRENGKLLDRFREAPKIFQLMNSSDPAERRRVKIERFREEKAMKVKLELLRKTTNESTVDEESQRRLYLAELEAMAYSSFQSLDLIVQELSVLAQADDETLEHTTRPQDPRESRRDKDGFSERLDGSSSGLAGTRSGPLLSKEGKPLQPFTIMDKRSEMRNGVFRPGHNLPTMSIDEYLEEEKRRGGIIDGGGPGQQPPPGPDEDDMEHVDRETMNARAWDEYVEANPKGSGNTLNRG